MKKICVIGAGVSGLTTIKQLLDEGHQPVCYEKNPDLGGLFNYQFGNVYKNTILTISNYQMAFSDFFPTEEKRVHWGHKEYFHYLKDYAKTHKLENYILYSKSIISMIEKNEKWEITIQCESTKEISVEIFDAVAVCTGTHQIPHTPKYGSLKNFKGEIYHGANYKDNEKFSGKKVLVVGIGESSADITREISDVSDRCHLLIRNYPFLIPRNQNYEAADANTSRALSSYSYPNKITYRILLVFYSFLFFMFNKFKMIFKLNELPESDSFLQKSDEKYLDMHTKHSEEAVKLIKSWNILSNSLPESKFATKNVTFVQNIISKKIDVIKDEIDRFKENGVVLKSGIFIHCDAVMFCTGYKEKFSFIKDYKIKDSNMRNLYLNAFHPRIKNVVFVGWNRPSLGAIPACSEMIARYFALIMSGKKVLPEDLERLTQERKEKLDNQFSNSPNLSTVVDYHEFMTLLSCLIGCDIKWYQYLFRPFFMYKLTFGGHMSLQYRLFGPHAKKRNVEKIINKLQISPSIKNVSLKLSILRFLGKDLTDIMTHEDIINKLFLPEVRVTKEDLKKYSYLPSKRK